MHAGRMLAQVPTLQGGSPLAQNRCRSSEGSGLGERCPEVRPILGQFFSVVRQRFSAFVSVYQHSSPAYAGSLATLEGTPMRKIILMMSISLDGFFEGPNRELDWQLVDDDLHTHLNE